MTMAFQLPESFLTVERKLIALLTAFVLVFISYVVARQVVQSIVEINGPAYRLLKQDAALLTDTVPPRLLVLEPYFIAREIVDHAEDDDPIVVTGLKQQFALLRARHAVAVSELAPHAQTIGLQAQFDSVGRTGQALLALLEARVLDGLTHDTAARARHVLDTEARTLFDTHRKAVEAFDVSVEAGRTARERGADAYASTWNAALTFVGIALVLGVTLVAALGARQLVFAPVRRAVEHFRAIAGGDLSRPVRTRRRDEFGEMLTALEHMRVSLQSAVSARDQSIAQHRVLSRAIESSPAAVVITDPNGVIEYVNPAFVGVTGYSAVEAIGRTPRLLNSGSQDAAFYQNLWSTISSGRIWRGDFVNKRKDGTLFEEAAAIAPVMDAHAAITHYVAVKTDVTRKRAIERRLAEAEQRYRHIVEHSVQGFYQGTPDGRMLMANDSLARMLGYENAAQLVAEPPGLWDRLHIDPSRRAAYVTAMHEEGAVYGFESQLRRRDGRPIWVVENARAVMDSNGTCTHCEAFLADITERKEAEQLKSDFIGFVTHQLRTPLAGIRWMLELAERDPSLSADVRTDIQDAHASALRLIGLVNELLDISRLENGRFANAPAPTDLRALTQSVLGDLAPLIHEKDQRVDVDGEDTPQVMVDPQLARQAVLNFLSNAVKYTPPGGTITVSACLEGRRLQWSVRDTGIGIPVASQRRLFEKFFRAENAMTMNTEGTGLGLYLVRLIAEQAGGSVSCSSIEGEGSTFTLSLPLAQPVGVAS